MYTTSLHSSQEFVTKTCENEGTRPAESQDSSERRGFHLLSEIYDETEAIELADEIMYLNVQVQRSSGGERMEGICVARNRVYREK